ncbi:hypothetical protein PInf_019240 [Phytophthora infestans]|nr:hypothetical protein PInf_019240 [Phytophthora infestans]
MEPDPARNQWDYRQIVLKVIVSPVGQTATGSSDTFSGTLQRHFEAAMSRSLAEQGMRASKPQAQVLHEREARDVEMESVEGDNSHDEFNPDDLDVPPPSPVAVATAASGTDGSSMTQRVRISAISDLKELTGKDQDYCGLGVSVARQYYHARCRSDESPLEYLHRLNVAGLRAKLKIKDAGSKVLQEHVDHFIETLGDADLVISARRRRCRSTRPVHLCRHTQLGLHLPLGTPSGWRTL